MTQHHATYARSTRLRGRLEPQSGFAQRTTHRPRTCAKIGKEPQKPASGKIMLRVPPEVHSAALIAAKASGTSLNQWAAKVLGEAAQA